MTSAYYYNQQQAGGVPPPVPQQARGLPGQIGINPVQGHYLQQQQQQQQQQYRNQAQLNDAHRKRVHSKPTRQNVPMTDDADEPSGDELDDISARDIAMARYKRNHDYLSEIFTPYNASSIVPPPLDINQTKEELDKQIKEYKERSVRQKREHQEKMIQLEKEQASFWSLMNTLTEANNLESIDQASADLAKEMGVKIEHRPHNVKVLSIPGIEEDTPEQTESNEHLEQKQSQQIQQQQQQTNDEKRDSGDQIMDDNNNNNHVNGETEDDNMDMFFNDQREGDDEGAGDSFFNEMVNTDDDPSVSEFLNTE